MSDISALFKLMFDYQKYFQCKSPIKIYTEIPPMNAAMINADRQTDKYEANWRFCYCTNTHKILMSQPRSKTFKGSLQLSVYQ